MRRLLVAQIGHATGSGDVARNRHPARVGNGDFDFNGTTTAGGPGNGVPLLADQYPSHERILETEPDLVVGGYASAFDDTTGRGPKTLEASCRRRCHPR
ncbi:hypothetical protein [Saccharopolyspora spinosa]|nr:hypothetical protein [Saccharopolyspora spinosa]